MNDRQSDKANPAQVNHQRAANLRQRMLRASRAVNTAIVTGLQEQGFHALRPAHTALLSNLALEGANLTEVAQRAGMTKQAMGRLADELVRLGYIERQADPADRRVVRVVFTPTGMALMQESFRIMGSIEERCARRIGQKGLLALHRALVAVAEELEAEQGQNANYS